MARLDDDNKQIVLENGKHVFLQKITAGTSGTVTALAATDADGAGLGAGSMLCLQADQDFYFFACPAGATTSVTVSSGTKPGLRVLQYVPYFITVAALDGALDVISTAAGTNLAVFVVK